MRNPEKTSILEIHLAVFCFGLAGLFGKLVGQPAPLIVLGRVAFATLFLALLLLSLKRPICLLRRQDYWRLAGLGVLLALHWVSFFQAIQVSTVAVGLITFSTFPVWVTFLEPYFLNERLRRADLALALLTVVGVALVIPALRLGNQMTQGALWGICSGLTFAVLSLLNRKYAQTYSSLVIALYQDATATLALCPFLLMEHPGLDARDLGLLVLLGVVFTGIAHSFFIHGLRRVKAHTASIIASLEPVYGIVFAALWLGEMPSPRVLAGGAIILGTALYVTTRPAVPTAGQT